MRLATFNIKHGATAKGYRGDPEAVAEACADLRADVLALQEVDKGVPRSGSADLAAMAADAADMSVVFAPTMRLQGGQYGNALLVRGEIDAVEVVRLKGGRWLQGRRGGGRIFPLGREPRNAIVATALVGGRRLSVAVTHLATQPDVNRRQLPQAVAPLQDRPQPWVLMGDLNMTTDAVRSEPLLRSMDLLPAPVTFPSWRPRKTVDHIATKGLVVGDGRMRVVRSPRVSDHLALVADVGFVAGP